MRISDWSSDVCSSDLMGRNAPHGAPVAPRDEQLRPAMFEPRILAGGQQVERLALQRRHPGGVAPVEAQGQLDELARSGPRGDGPDGNGTLGVCGHLWFPGWCGLYSARRITGLIRRWRPAFGHFSATNS